MWTVRVLRDAEAEIRSSMRWYEEKRIGLGLDFVALVDEAISQIAERPFSYPLWRKERPYRKAAMRRFPFTVFYTVEDDYVQVVAVAHQKRRPGYWTER